MSVTTVSRPAANRSKRRAKAAPVEPDVSDRPPQMGTPRGLGTGGEDEEDEAEEENAAVDEEDPIVEDDSDDDDDDDDDDDPKSRYEAMNESARENARAREIDAAAMKAGIQARAKSIRQQRQGSGGGVDIKLADRAAYEAAEKVRRKAAVGRLGGWYVMSQFDGQDEDGNRVTYIPGARLPDKVAEALKKAGDLKKLRRGGVVEDRRMSY